MPTEDGVTSRKAAAVAAGKPWRLRISVLAGAANDVNIPITGIQRGVDQIVAAFISQPASGDGAGFDEVTDELNITSDGNVQLDTTSGTGKQLLVIWYDVRP